MDNFLRNGDAWKVIAGLLIFFVPIVLYAVQVPYYQNCLHLPKWLLTHAGLGALLGGSYGFYLIRNREGDFLRMQIVIAGIIIGSLLLPLVATLINRLPFSSDPVQEKVEVISVHAFQQNRFGNALGDMTADGYYIYVLYQNEVIRLQADSEEQLTAIAEGDEVDILVKPGLLGLESATLIFSEGSL